VGCLQTILADVRTEVLDIWSGPKVHRFYL